MASKQFRRNRLVSAGFGDEQPGRRVERCPDSPEQSEGDESQSRDGDIDVEVLGDAARYASDDPSAVGPPERVVVAVNLGFCHEAIIGQLTGAVNQERPGIIPDWTCCRSGLSLMPASGQGAIIG